MSDDTQPPRVDDLSREELYAEISIRVDELSDASTIMQTILNDAPPIEPAGSHIDQRNERLETQLDRAKSLLNVLDQLHDELQRR